LAPIFRIAAWGDSFNFQPEAPLWTVVVPLWWLGLPVAWLTGRWLMTRSHRPWLATPDPTTMFLLFAWGLLPAILAGIVCQGDLSSLSNPRYRIGFVGPSACLLAACLIQRRSAAVATASVVIALSLGWIASPRWPWELKRLGNPRAVEWREMALDIQARGHVRELLFVQGGLGEGFMVPAVYNDRLFQDYLACRMGRFYLKTEHPRYGLPFLWGQSEEMVVYYRELLRQHAQSESASLWVASATDTDLNRASFAGFDQILSLEGYRKQDDKVAPNTRLVHYIHESRP
jgi:hypothetical protein